MRGQVTERRLGSPTGVLRQRYAYTAAENFRLVSLQAGNASPYANLQNISYGYDDVGNVLTITDAAAYDGDATPATQTQTFTYDPLHRLSTAQASGSTPYGGYAQRSYGYNNAGNVISFEGATFTYENTAHKHAVTHIGGVQKYWYDPNGNATRRINGSQDITLAYDAENRLTGLTSGVTASHVYDGDGKRVKETISGVMRIFIGNYYEVDSGVVKKYYYAGSTRVAENRAGTLYYLLSDHLGSTAVTTDSAGNRVTELRYYPYGASRYNPGGQITTYRFTGQRWDSGTAIYFYNARWYDPTIGRFLQADSIVPSPGNPQDLNRYAYCRNNPLTYIDQDGHFAILPLLLAGGAAALVSAGVDLGKQLIVDQKDFANVNWGEVGGAAAGGFVAGATLGLAPAGASVVGLGLLGAAGGAAGSQAQAITQAGLEELLGTNPQGSVIAEAKNLGLLDAQTMLINAGVGGLMGGLGGKFAEILRAKLNLPEAAGIARMSGELPHVRWQMRLDQPGVWTAQLEGRVINISADTFEKIVRGMAIGGYELVAKILEEAIQQGAVQVLEQEVQP